jgi:dihydroorotase
MNEPSAISSERPALVIAGARILDPKSARDEVGDIVIEGGRITRVGPGAAIRGARVETLDGRGLWAVPGLFDLHVHFREPGQEYKEDIRSGLAAALAGGFTTVCTMPNTRPTTDTRAIVESIVARAREVGGARLLPFGAITRGLAGAELTEMADLRDAGAIGVSDDGRCVMNAAVMRHALEYASTFDLLVSQHAEDHHLTEGAVMHEGRVSAELGLRGWPREAEDVIVARDLLLVERTRARYHVAHVSSLGAVRLLREAKSRGLAVSAEVTPHHLALTEDDVAGYQTYCKVNPPLRSLEDRAALRAALADGTIDCMATDHAPHSALEKDCPFEEALVGINGLETAVSIVLGLVRDGTMSPLRFAEVTSTAPARIARDESAGSLAVGARADVALVDPTLRWKLVKSELRSKSHNTPFLERELEGRVVCTIAGGVIAHRAEVRSAR